MQDKASSATGRAHDERWMRRALEMAEQARVLGEVPVGAVVVLNGELIATGFNQCISRSDPSGHAEVVALRAAAKALGNYRLVGCTLYSTIEPCAMCAGALVHARVQRLVFGAPEPKAGVVGSNGNQLQAGHLNHRIEVLGGVLADEASAMISDFFRRRREQKKRTG